MSGELGIGRIKLINKVIEQHWQTKPESMHFKYNEVLFLIQEILKDEGREYFAERVGLRGFHIFREFVKMLLYRNVANYDSMVLVSSEKGTGKSSAAIMMAREWCRLIGIPFNPKRHIAYNNADVMNKLESLDKFEPLICDEAVRFASATDWAKRENRELKKKLAQVRTKHLFFILCFPLKVYKVDKVYLESFVNYWCLTGDTLVKIFEDGKIKEIQIKDLIDKKGYKLLTYNINNKKIELKKPEKCILTKKNVEVYEVELENGQKIKATAEHQFLTQNGYKRLIDLTEDDKFVYQD